MEDRAEKTGLIRPRTTSERRAYLSGYGAALNDVGEDGLEKARTYLRLLVDAEASEAEPGPVPVTFTGEEADVLLTMVLQWFGEGFVAEPSEAQTAVARKLGLRADGTEVVAEGAEPAEPAERYGYSAAFNVRVYYCAINNDDAFAARDRLKLTIEQALAGPMEVDGASVEPGGVHAEWTQR